MRSAPLVAIVVEILGRDAGKEVKRKGADVSMVSVLSKVVSRLVLLAVAVVPSDTFGGLRLETAAVVGVDSSVKGNRIAEAAGIRGVSGGTPSAHCADRRRLTDRGVSLATVLSE